MTYFPYGIRYGSPRCVYLPDGSARLYAHTRAAGGDVSVVAAPMQIISALAPPGGGLGFERERGPRLVQDRRDGLEVCGPLTCCDGLEALHGRGRHCCQFGDRFASTY
eukprot:SAG11_NODE_13612_length_647_cov_1.312044_2_plen_108_part_00